MELQTKPHRGSGTASMPGRGGAAGPEDRVRARRGTSGRGGTGGAPLFEAAACACLILVSVRTLLVGWLDRHEQAVTHNHRVKQQSNFCPSAGRR